MITITHASGTLLKTIKGEKIIAGLRKATCKWCGKPGQTVMCRCNAKLTLDHRNFRTDVNPLVLSGPMGKLP